MKKITQKKSNLKLLVESIADGMTNLRESLPSKDKILTDQDVANMHGECPITIKDANGKSITCDKFIIGNKVSEAVYLSRRGREYDYVAQVAIKFTESERNEFKQSWGGHVLLRPEWQESYYNEYDRPMKVGFVRHNDSLKAWLGDEKVYDNTNGGSVNEASDGTCVVVRYRAPAEKGVKDYSVRMTIDELHQFVEANGNPVDIQEFMTRLSENGSADFDANEPITFLVERA